MVPGAKDVGASMAGADALLSRESTSCAVALVEVEVVDAPAAGAVFFFLDLRLGLAFVDSAGVSGTASLPPSDVELSTPELLAGASLVKALL
jgi:hypothetical protein